jgi:hypothetical protein
MNNKKILWILSIIFSFLMGLILTKQFPQIFDLIKGVSSGVKHSIDPPKISKDFKINNEIEINEKISTNSFTMSIKNTQDTSIKDLLKDRDATNQHVNAGLYGKKIDGKVHIRFFTRNGFEINNGVVTQYSLPKTYDPHNSKGGIRGIFFFNNDPYAWMASKTINCNYASIVNLKKSREIFKTECLIDLPRINYDGVGGAAIHKNDKILLTTGTPANNSDRIRSLAQNKESYFGKILAISKKELKEFDYSKEKNIFPKIFTLGHRNPQGLAKINDNYYSAEHGPKGGDEINLLIKNENYGWPISSYGTKYFFEPNNIYNKGENVTKFYKNSHTKYNFNEPLYQFTPSIAISAITNCPKILQNYYERKYCLLGTSLKDKSLYIFILDETKGDRLIGFEKISFKKRLRNFALDYNGKLFEDNKSIYISTDDGYVLKVTFNL